MGISSDSRSLPPSLVAFAQMPLARWGEIGPAPLQCGRGRFMVPGVENLETAGAIRDLLALALLRGIERRKWVRHAPILRGCGAWADYLPDLAIERAYGYALRASSARSQLETLAAPAARRLLPFVTWCWPGGPPGEPHAGLNRAALPSADPLVLEFAPPLGYDCCCCFGVVNLAKAKRDGEPRRLLLGENLAREAPPGWRGAPPPIDARDDRPARSALNRAAELLAAAGLSWPQSRGVGAGASLSG